jgi:hypothetical protein
VNTKFSSRKGERNNKLRTYTLFKREFKFENYLLGTKNITQWKTLTQFRLSAHTLKIEMDRINSKGQYVPPDQRKCTNCTLNETEDEEHFLVNCPRYENLRKEFYKEITERNVHFPAYPPRAKFLWLMSNEDSVTQNHLAKYLKESLDMRKRPS